MLDKVRHKFFQDHRGILFPMEHTSLPFVPVRSFVVCGVPPKMERGGHAHYKCQQYAVVVKGVVMFDLFDGITHQTGPVSDGQGVFIPELVWDTQIFYTEDAVLLVYCSIPYDQNDYITDQKLFIELKTTKK